MAFDITTVPAHLALSLRKEVPLKDVSSFIQPAFGSLEQVFEQAGVLITSCRAYTYAISPDDIDIAAGFVFALEDKEAMQHACDNANDGPYGDFEILEFDEAQAAATTFTGTYNNLTEAWDDFAQEVAVAGVKVKEPSFEDYIDMGSETHDPVTKLYWYLD